MKMEKCKQCGTCCRRSIIDEVYDLDLEREPRLEACVEPIRDQPGFYSLGPPCPFVMADNRCRIYPTRPSLCVAYEPGSTPICPRYTEQPTNEHS